MNTRRALYRSGVVLYFIIALEVLIMISPFAGFFYAVFNPVLLKLASNGGTRWLSAFFLPHMVLPSDPLLVVVRVLGSVLFVLGMAVFFLCAGQIYTAKLTKKGAVRGGLYSRIRHPQYLALGIAGIGLSILWPRFLNVVLWLVMLFLYYFLARDEERRMLASHGDSYRGYMATTGMFLPQGTEDRILLSSFFARASFAFGIVVLALGSAFLLRLYTVDHLTLWNKAQNVTALAILPEDGFKMDHRMQDVLNIPEVKSRIADGKSYLVYFLPKDYIMQGMIADTGEDWKLFNQHHSIAMITDWIFNPFGHLREGHHAMHGAIAMEHHAAAAPADGVVRRLIFLSADTAPAPSELFAINTLRTPQFMADVEMHTMQLLGVRDLPHGSGWGTVPTPLF